MRFKTKRFVVYITILQPCGNRILGTELGDPQPEYYRVIVPTCEFDELYAAKAYFNQLACLVITPNSFITQAELLDHALGKTLRSVNNG